MVELSGSWEGYGACCSVHNGPEVITTCLLLSLSCRMSRSIPWLSRDIARCDDVQIDLATMFNTTGFPLSHVNLLSLSDMLSTWHIAVVSTCKSQDASTLDVLHVFPALVHKDL